MWVYLSVSSWRYEFCHNVVTHLAWVEQIHGIHYFLALLHLSDV